MDAKQMFSLLKTCIIGESFRACGVGYDPEDNLETYHLSDFCDDYAEEDVTGTFRSPEHFLEDLCGSSVVQIYDAIRTMESAWNGGGGVVKVPMPICKSLWELGCAEACMYLEDFCEEESACWFAKHGISLFKK
ncbi:unnamed protein product [Pylaiella littoralis]